MTNEECCLRCRYYKDDARSLERDLEMAQFHIQVPVGNGSCHRYPEEVRKYTEDWCGEFRRIENP